jgi:CheY-like chemotaxis protein
LSEVELKGLHILVVEDAPDVLDMLTTLFRLEGADVVGAPNGRDALAVYRGDRFDVVVIDLGLPDIPGEVLIRTMITEARRPLTVVVITGEGEPALTRALEAGANAIFIKPCEWGDVLGYLHGLGLVAAA